MWLKSCRLSPSTSILSKCPIRKEMKRALFTWILRYVKKTSLGHIAGFVKLRGVAMYCSCRSYLCHFLPRGKVSCPHCFQSCESRAFSNLMDVILPDVSPTGAVPPTPIRLGSCEKKALRSFFMSPFTYQKLTKAELSTKANFINIGAANPEI